jgi:Golgi SNAP receptor complex protein 2
MISSDSPYVKNALFNSALKQSSAVRKDLDSLANAPSSSTSALQGNHLLFAALTPQVIDRAIGQISASLTSFSRTIDDYNNMAKRELIPAKQEKAFERVKTFRSEIAEYRQQFEHLKAEREESVSASEEERGGMLSSVGADVRRSSAANGCQPN